MQNQKEYILSIDEFAAAMNLTGRSDEAKSLLGFGSYKNVSIEETRGRLIAGHNSLFAKNLSTIDTPNRKIVLDNEIRNVIDIIFKPGSLVRCNKGGEYGERILTIYIGENDWLAQYVKDEIIYKFVFPLQKQEAIDEVIKFLAPDFSNYKETEPIELPQEIFDNGFSPSGKFSQDFVSHVADLVPQNQSAKLLLDDFNATQWRGTTIWMDQSKPNKIITRGAFWIEGDKRLWMLQSKPELPKKGFTAKTIKEDEFSAYIDSVVSSL